MRLHVNEDTYVFKCYYVVYLDVWFSVLLLLHALYISRYRHDVQCYTICATERIHESACSQPDVLRHSIQSVIIAACA